ncbi:MAG TPA: cobyrinate a,c-diamide synthase [Streptosporangiaceae bacterium]|nr:cobyrinate a,c-diamide synthase [Streptosporangiaceae bacterium]
MVSIPRLVVAAPASGQGKTTVATGLMAALANRGLAVSGHKVGPDYIDPGYHALATGRPGRNLDPVLCGEELIGPLFLHGCAGADVAIVEGAMGLIDGRGLTSEGSTAHVAALLGAPVVLVVDASAQGRSVAALVSGFAAYDPQITIGGVILNRVGSARHEEILRAALADAGMPVLGALRREDAVVVPSRHLGLVPVVEREREARVAVRRLASLVAAAVDLDALFALARSAPPLSAAAWSPLEALAGSIAPGTPTAPGTPAGGATPSVPGGRPRPVVAVAGGSAFSFSYAETTELLAAAGGEVVHVDPLRDEALPPGAAALVLGGGFPEMHAGDLSANVRLRADVARLAASGAPVAAECAGLLYLTRDLDGAPMCGVLAASAAMTSRLTLGYREATARSGSALVAAGTNVLGHEFHRTAVTPGSSPAPAWAIAGRAEGFVSRGVHASFLHLHWAGYPQAALRLVAAARGLMEPAEARATCAGPAACAAPATLEPGATRRTGAAR